MMHPRGNIVYEFERAGPVQQYPSPQSISNGE